MARKLFLSIFFVVLFVSSLFESAPIATRRADNIDFFEEYLNRKFVLLNEDESPILEAACFRTQLLINASDNFDYLLGQLTDEQSRRQMNWLLEHVQNLVAREAFAKEEDGEAKCNSAKVEYMFSYELPKGWDMGGAFDYMDALIIHRRRVFEANNEESCENPDRFHDFLEYLPPKLTVEYVEPLEDGVRDIIFNVCYPVKTFDEVPEFENDD